jgi:hypothetical protein
VKEYLSTKPKWAQFSTDQQTAGAARLSKATPRGRGKKKALQEDIDKRLIADILSASKSKTPESVQKNDTQLAIFTQLGETMKQIGTVFAGRMEREDERMEREDERRNNEEDIDCLLTPDRVEYRRDLLKIKAIKIKLKRHRLEEELEKSMAARAPKVIRCGSVDDSDDKSED